MASGRVQERERFVRDFLRHHGARLEGPPYGALVAELPKALARRLKTAEKLEIAFRPAELGEHPGAALLAPGNPLFDRMLRLAQKGGGLSRRYLRPERNDPPSSWPATEGALAGIRFGTSAYRRHLLFTFRIAYRAFEGYDEIRSVMVGGDPTEAADGRDFFRDRNLVDEPAPAIEAAPPVDVEGALLAALAEIERRITPRMVRFVQRAEEQLANETERLREFYLAAIAEEKARRERQNGRNETGSVGRGEPKAIAATGRKLEWVERVDRETRLFAPRVTVTLLGLEEVWMPVCSAVLDGPEGELQAELDLASGEILYTVCHSCRAPLGTPRRARVAPVGAVCYPPRSHDSRAADTPPTGAPPKGPRGSETSLSNDPRARALCPACARARGA
jgi:hypothetical protein